ncbi:hypothetical protein BDZ85DRAFT_321719 [Elsinoe ampelina]|uniref:F-box domain-containing protein n=1 Tax=Elsinoe ampelina TaxID=302913 RepID=A0A6A6G3W9_9PEZI|nr:hypothetical protein BDZ85DRAFT_321719 [Elsinoe ampelina]
MGDSTVVRQEMSPSMDTVEDSYAAMPGPMPFDLIGLPTEIRHMVYAIHQQYIDEHDFLYVSITWNKADRVLKFCSEYAIYVPNMLPLVLTCKTISTEILPYFYATPCFQLRFGNEIDRTVADLRASYHCFRYMRNVEILLDPFCRFSRALKQSLELIEWAEQIAYMEISVGNSCSWERREHCELLEAGGGAEVERMLAYWGQIRFKDKVDLWFCLFGWKELRDAEAQRQIAMKLEGKWRMLRELSRLLLEKV